MAKDVSEPSVEKPSAAAAVGPPVGVMSTSAGVESLALFPSPPQPMFDEAIAPALGAKYVKPVGLVTGGVVCVMMVGECLGCLISGRIAMRKR